MITLLKKLFGKTSSTDFAKLLEEGALILDVRTRNEYAGGHVKNSLNIPLNELPAQLKKLKKEITIITCCASGMRSASAKNILQANGFTAYNGGSWVSLKKYGQ